MRKIWKYKIPGVGKFTLNIPVDYVILAVQLQDSYPQMWINVNPENPSQPVEFEVVGTGRDVPANSHYRGTWQEGQFVWHLFQRI